MNVLTANYELLNSKFQLDVNCGNAQTSKFLAMRNVFIIRTLQIKIDYNLPAIRLADSIYSLNLDKSILVRISDRLFPSSSNSTD